MKAKMEGPSIHLLEEELLPFNNQIVIDCFGNALFDKEILINQKIKEIFAFGKRLIIQLDQHAIIVHFLMYGSYRINEERQGFTPRFALITKKNSFYIYNCSVRCLPVKNIKDYLPLELDILSPDWDVNKIIKLIKSNKNETIDDILLNQHIFPGVGNIIKNEVLFLSNILPNCKISRINSKKLKEIILNARLFSQKFLELRKKFELKKNLLIYRKSFCQKCKAKIIRKKTGKTNRWSFFCLNCQKC